MIDYLKQLEKDACDSECNKYIASISNKELKTIIIDAFKQGWKSHSIWFEKNSLDDGK